MKNIIEIYESIVDDDKSVLTNVHRQIDATPDKINKYFREFIRELHVGYNYNGNKTDKWEILPDGTIEVFKSDYSEITINQDLPDYIQFSKIKDGIDVNMTNVSTLRGLPANMSNNNLLIRNCPNLKNLENGPREVKMLMLRDCYNLESFKGCPNCGSIKIKYCGKRELKDVAKYTRTSKKNITILQ